MNQDMESQDTLLQAEIYMILLYNLICVSRDRVRGRSVIELKKKRVRLQLKWGLSFRIFRNIVILGRGQERMDRQLR